MKKVFFGSNDSINEKFFMDVKQDSEIEYCDFYEKLNSKIKKFFFKQKILKLMPFFVKKIIFRKIMNYDFLKSQGENYLFVFCNSYQLFGNPQFILFLEFLKRNFKNSKFAFYYYAVIDTCYPSFFPEIKKNCDLVLTFNRYCADKYDIEFYGPVCEKDIVQPIFTEQLSADVFYAGNVYGVAQKNTDRVQKVAECFKYLSDNDKVCVFYLDGVTDDEKATIKNILKTDISGEELLTYKKSKMYFKYLPYAKAKGYLLNSKAMLEIVLPTGYAMCTSRLAQALVEEKKLITNCVGIQSEKFFCKENIIVFQNATDIDLNLLEMPFEKTEHNFSGKALINHIENELCK